MGGMDCHSWCSELFLLRLDDPVHNTVLQGFFRGHEFVAIGVLFHFFEFLARVLGDHLVQEFFGFDNVVRVNSDVGGLAFGAAQGLVDHHFGMGQNKALAFGAAH